jgi:hypothetical protein
VTHCKVARKEFVGHYLECKYCDTRLHGTAITSVCSCKTQLLISMFHAMQPPVSIVLCVCCVFSANTIVKDADGNDVRACVKGGVTGGEKRGHPLK